MSVDILRTKPSIPSKTNDDDVNEFSSFSLCSSSIDIPEFPIDIQVVLELLVAADFLDC